MVSYSSRFEGLILQAFDSHGPPNQHLCHFKSLAGSVGSNDIVLACLFIGTLRGVAFEWLMKLPTKLVRFGRALSDLILRNELEVNLITLLATKQRAEESVKVYWRDFGALHFDAHAV